MSDEDRSARTSLRDIRVAVIDDEPEMARFAARTLKGAGAAVDVFLDAPEALRAHEQRPFDVIFSDILMPAMSGVELLRALRQHDMEVPVLLCTGTPTFETARQAVDLGAFRYLTKPYAPAELCDAVHKAAFAHRMAALKRQAASLDGANESLPADRAGLEAALDAALEQLFIAYQPIVRSKDGTAFGYEALMRTAAKALPNPGAILDAAERLGRLDDVGRAVRRLAPLPISDLTSGEALFVNMHPRDLADPDLFADETPMASGSSRIVLEITERAAFSDIPGATDAIAILKQRGYRIAVDDLGSGYAGLTSFAVLEPEIVKLDMLLIRSVDTNIRKQKLIRSMVQLCHDLGVLIVAEGIETLAERECCVELGVDLLQGFFLARPGKAFPEIAW